MSDLTGVFPTNAEIHRRWGWFVALGIGLVVVGAIAFVNLFAATIASVLYVGAMMIVGGVLQIIHAFQVRTWGHFWFWMLGGLLYAAAGIACFANPILASTFLTLVLGAGLLVAGLFRCWAAFQVRPAPGWGWILAGGVITLLAGLVILLQWPLSGLWLLGLMLAVDLLFQGCTFLAFGLALRTGR